MPRQGRKKSKSGIYHIMVRGINRQVIFKDDEDREKLLEALKHYKAVSEYEIYGYCLMDNHIHLLIKEVGESISTAIKRISGSYVYWYNQKYDRCGHLFQGRFRSEGVEDDRYFLTVLRYIHQNPVKAGLYRRVEEFKWSSIHEYAGKSSIIDVEFTLNMFSDNREKSIKLLHKYMNEENEDKCLDYDEKYKLTDDEVRSYLEKLGITNTNLMKELEKSKRNEILKAAKSIDGITIRQLARVTGLSKSIVERS